MHGFCPDGKAGFGINAADARDGKNMNRQDPKSAEETRYAAFEISSEFSQTRSVFYMTCRSGICGELPAVAGLEENHGEE